MTIDQEIAQAETEEIVAGQWDHGAEVARFASGLRLLGCRCGEVVHEVRWRSHIATHRRESIVHRASMDSVRDREGLDFSPRLHSPSETWPNGRRRSRPRAVRSSRSKR